LLLLLLFYHDILLFGVIDYLISTTIICTSNIHVVCQRQQ